ncbi:MAG: thiamine pyrophosphate-dependent enzyme [Thermonemataceae bacterium]|nr:thiamine pyrophosphate-dependent enzyme [Thermonemataceae bacterium]
MSIYIQNTATGISLTKEAILEDYRIVCESREASLVGRKEVFMGKAKFGIFGDGKELAQIAMAKAFQVGDWRSGYYRDQTFMLAIGELTLEAFFAQLYADTNVENDPASAGRCMNAHFATRFLEQDGSWKNLTELKNSSADISPTAGQMPRLLGLAWASKLFRNNPELRTFTNFSNNGNEIAFGTIGNASTSEGMFFETINAAGVLQVPMLMSVWDDEYGISVSKEYHTTKHDISKVLAGFQTNTDGKGLEIFKVKAWDYLKLIDAYQKATKICRDTHSPVLIHVVEVTQQQGHSTSGSHERYKSKERLEWEANFDCNKKFREWILDHGVANVTELELIENQAKERVKQARTTAWSNFLKSVKNYQTDAENAIADAINQSPTNKETLEKILKELKETINPIKKDSIVALKKALRSLRFESESKKRSILNTLDQKTSLAKDEYNSYLYSQSEQNALFINEKKVVYADDAKVVDGREVLQANFEAIFTNNPLVVAFGEDVGKIGDVNQGFAGLQDKFGEIRISDTSIRECTILGQAIGAAMRGLRPIAEIQYLDYLLYALQIMSDDLASLQYRTKGGQKSPVIIRTRGHRLEGIWHSGSPIGMIINALRGIRILVPRNMTIAAGFYNTMLQSDEPALIIECLNGYRLKEKMPENLGEFTVPLGKPEILKQGTDFSIVTYGSMCRIVMEAAEQLEEVGISVEVIDVQTLLPFDVDQVILESVKKTNRIAFADEDVEGGASAFMMQQVLEVQGAYRFLDAAPITIHAQDHRPAYASDGDYFSKPNAEDIFDKIYAIMQEANPQRFPEIY